MAYPKALLSHGEQVVLDLHPHWKQIALPVALVPVVIGLAAFAAAEAPDGSAHRPVQYAVLVVAVVSLLRFSARPFLRWQSTQYVLTNRRIVHRAGVLSRSGRDVPLNRVNDVSFEHNLWERILGCGTLVIESAGERGQVVFGDVPRVERVQHTVYDLIQETDARAGDPADAADADAGDAGGRNAWDAADADAGDAGGRNVWDGADGPADGRRSG